MDIACNINGISSEGVGPTTIEDRTFDEECSLYGSCNLVVRNCSFDGPVDGESALKESSMIEVEGCFLNLRYPFWHDHGLSIRDSVMTERCCAPVWFSSGVRVDGCRIHGIKAFWECVDVVVSSSDIVSPEFGWSVRRMRMDDSSVEGEYFMMRSGDLSFSNVSLKGEVLVPVR